MFEVYSDYSLQYKISQKETLPAVNKLAKSLLKGEKYTVNLFRKNKLLIKEYLIKDRVSLLVLERK